MYIDSSRLKELAAESTFIPKSIRRRRKSTMDVFAPNPLRASSHLTHVCVNHRHASPWGHVSAAASRSDFRTGASDDHSGDPIHDVWNAESEESVASYLLKEIDLLSQAALQINQPPAKGVQHGIPQTSLGLDVATSAHNHEENCPQKPPKHHSLCSVDPVFCLSGIPCASLAHDGSMETFDLVEYADCCKETSPSDGLKGLNCQMAEVTISKCGDDLPTASSSTENSSTEEEWTKIKEWKNLNTARRDATEPRRPKNGFLRFSSKFRREIAARHPRLDNRDISKLLGAKWRKMTAEEKRPYEQEFAQDIRKIRDKNPRWRYAPARYSQDELVEPMPNRLRPHDKIKRKKYEDFSCTWRPYKRKNASGRRKKCQPSDESNSANNEWDSFSYWHSQTCHLDEDHLSCNWYCSRNPDGQMSDFELLTVDKDMPCAMHAFPSVFCTSPHQSAITATNSLHATTAQHANYMMM